MHFSFNIYLSIEVVNKSRLKKKERKREKKHNFELIYYELANLRQRFH